MSYIQMLEASKRSYCYICLARHSIHIITFEKYCKLTTMIHSINTHLVIHNGIANVLLLGSLTDLLTYNNIAATIYAMTIQFNFEFRNKKPLKPDRHYGRWRIINKLWWYFYQIEYSTLNCVPERLPILQHGA